MRAVVTSGDDVIRVYTLEQAPFAFSGLSSSVGTAGPGENVTVDVTVENVDDETATGQLSAGQSETVTFEAAFGTAGSWDLSIKRALEREAAVGPVSVDVVHSPSADDWPIRGFDRGASDANSDTDGPTQHIQDRWNVSGFDEETQPVWSRTEPPTSSTTSTGRGS